MEREDDELKSFHSSSKTSVPGHIHSDTPLWHPPFLTFVPIYFFTVFQKDRIRGTIFVSVYKR